MAANGRRYSISGNITSAAGKSLLTLGNGGTIVRPAIFDIMLSSFATPADNAAQWQLRRYTTTAGTVTAFVPVALDSGDPASQCQIAATGFNATVEPAYTTSTLLDIGLNQRATFRWVAAPNSEFVGPATATTGFGIQCIAVNAGVAGSNGTILFME